MYHVYLVLSLNLIGELKRLPAASIRTPSRTANCLKPSTSQHMSTPWIPLAIVDHRQDCSQEGTGRQHVNISLRGSLKQRAGLPSPMMVIQCGRYTQIDAHFPREVVIFACQVRASRCCGVRLDPNLCGRECVR